MKKGLILLLLIALVQVVDGKIFEIIYINTPTITINGAPKKVGDRFDDKAKIKWASESQAMEVISDDNQIYTISPKLLKKLKKKNWTDCLTRIETLGTRNGVLMSVDDHRELFEGYHVLIRVCRFKVGWPVDDNSYFVASTNAPDKKISFKIPTAGDEIALTRELLAPLLENENVDELSLTIEYIETEYNMSTLLTEAMNLIIVPERLKDL